MRNITSLIAFVLLSWILSCNLYEKEFMDKVESNIYKTSVSNGSVKVITPESIYVQTQIDSFNLSIIQHGWVWNSQVSRPPDVSIDRKTENGKLFTKFFNAKIGKFSCDSTYQIRPYVVLANGSVCYGKLEKFNIDLPILENPSILFDSACKVSFKVFLQCSPIIPPVEYGLLYRWDEIPNQKVDTLKSSNIGLNKVFYTDTLYGLIPSSKYSIWAYAKNAMGEITKVGPIKITTPGAYFSNFEDSINTDFEIFKGAMVRLKASVNGEANFKWSFSNGYVYDTSSIIHEFKEIDKINVDLKVYKGGCETNKKYVFEVLKDPFENYWVPVPGGTFNMGCPNFYSPCQPEALPHKVTLTTFNIGRTEVTQGQWFAVTKNKPSYFACDKCPVEQVSWLDIENVFLPLLYKKTGIKYSLPSEAQWEFAAKGGHDTDTLYSGSNNPDVVAWYNALKTKEVCSLKPNRLGICDMSGNVNEWCKDRFKSYNSSSFPTDTTHVYRGGDFTLKRTTTGQRDLTVFRRFSQVPSVKNENIGFRLVQNINN